MTPPLRRDEPPGARPFETSRCARCGRRITASCPVHGAPGLAAGELDASRIAELAHPRVPGHRVRRLVARGGFGVVFEAERERDGARVAIKLARDEQPDARACLAREIAALGRIGPPHVPAVHERGHTELGAPYVVMEYVDAPTLAERLQDRLEPLPVAEAGALVLAILGALAGVHARGYVHLDVKPENIFVDAAMKATLVDLGLAVRASRASTEEGEGAGTAEYMAPERCEGPLALDARADVYAVGVILFELLAGRPPFWGSHAVVKESHLSRRPPRVSAMREGAVPEAIEQVVARCLAKDRGERFGSAGELAAALQAALREPALREPALREPAPAAPAPPAGPARGERVTVGLLFFETALDLAALQARLSALGAELGHAAGGRCVAVFKDELADNPARRARLAAEELIRLGVCERARVDLAPVVVQARRDGSRRCFSPLFSRAERFPNSGDAEGVTIAPAAREVLHEIAAPHQGGDAERMADPETWSFVGRDAILTSLVESARRAVGDAAPTLVSVIAEAGQGKSHLARVLEGRLAELGAGAGVLSLRAREPALGDVDRALAELLGRVLDLPASPGPDGGAALLRDRLGPGGADLAPAVALALGWLTPGAEGSPLDAALRAQSAAPGALRSALTLATGEALRRRAASGPLLVVLDDAHFAGDAVLEALEYAAVAGSGAPLWVCALGRPPFERARPSWGQRAARHEQHELGPLDPASAAALCRRLLLPVESAPESAVQRLVARAQATPLLLVELVRGLRREGLVRKSPKGEAWYLATDELDRVPELPIVEWLARREIDALAPPLRSHARLIALLGEQVSPEDLEGVLHRLSLQAQPGDVELPLDGRIGTRRLLAARVVVEDGAGRVGFRHALVREAVARAVPEDQRRRIHRAAAEHHGAGAGGAGDERRLAQLAYHAGEAGLSGVAARSFFELAERARARHAYTDAERLYSRALEQPGGLDRRPGYRGRGLMRYRIGRYHDALADLSAARALAAQAGDVAEQIELLLDEATALDWMDGFAASAQRVEEARALVPVPGARSSLLEARLLLGLGRSAFRFSRNEEAAALLERAAAAAAPLGDEGYETHVIALFQLGFLLPALGRPDEARRALDRSVALAEEHGDRLHLGSALNVRGVLWANLGDKARLVADMDRSLSIARELGQTSLELMGEFNLAEYLLFLDDAAAAEPHVRRAQALDRRISGDPGLAAVALLEARLHVYRGEARAAGEIVARVRARRQKESDHGEPDTRFPPSDDVLCAVIELSQRDAGAEAWDALEARAERHCVAQERLEVIEARGAAAERQGRLAEARSHLDRALALAREAPNAMGGRIARRIAQLEGPPGPPRA